MNTRLLRVALGGMLFSCTFTSLAIAAEEPTLGEALAKGSPSVALRYRVEEVSDDATDKDALASTLRTTLSYRTLAFKGWSFFIEAENVAAIGNDLYKNAGAGSLSNGVTDRPVVADPAGTEINQASVSYQHNKTTFKLGRQEVLLNDVRFVGNVGWRQNHQSFDALRITDGSFDKLDLSYSYVTRVHRIFGDSKDMASHLLDASYVLGKLGKLTGYTFLLDYDKLADAGLSTTTYGLEFKGAKKLSGDRKFLYEIELAEQRDYANNQGQISAGYRHLLVGGTMKGLTLKVGWEILEGNSSQGQFQTPLATLHKFNGWADKFLRTPTNGLEDFYLSLSGKAGKVGWVAIFHDFTAESTSTSYGDEVDLQVTFSSPWSQEFGFTAALYDADEFSVDTDKLMLWTRHKF